MIFSLDFLELLSEFTSLIWILFFSIICSLLILLFNIIQFLIFIKRLKEFRKLKDPDEILISDFKSLPLVNIIIPAWKEGEIFKNLLFSITQLNYPKIKVITNAGGNEETIHIANSFKKFENFVILYQKEGSARPSLGKINAINECLKYVSQGIIYFIDADSYLNNDVLLRMIHPIINLNENVVMGGVRPLKSQMKKILVKYLQFDRFGILSRKFDRYILREAITGQNFCINYNVLKSIEKFTFQKLIPTDHLMGRDIYSKGFKAYRLVDYRHRIFVDYSASFKEYFHQRLVWNENFLYKNLKSRNVKNLIKFFILWSTSVYSLIFPFLIILDIRFLFPGVLIFFTIYLKKLRKLFTMKKTIDKEYYESYKIPFFFYLIFFIFFDFIITSYAFFHFFYFARKIKRQFKET
ncbi:MAG: glycosyltransferase [Promethearchaeota archaeon]